MPVSATELVGRLDAAGAVAHRISALAGPPAEGAIGSLREFEEAYLDLVTNRLIEANQINEWTRKFPGDFGNVHARTQSLFLRMIAFAAERKDTSLRRDLYLLLSYLKPESPEFATEVRALSSTTPAAHVPVPKAFISYILSATQERKGRIPGLSIAGHFRNTRQLQLAAEPLRYRVAHVARADRRRVYCGCSSADSLLFDPTKEDFDVYVTLPGLSLRHLRADILVSIHREILAGLAPDGAPPKQITLCLGFVDRLKVAGAFDALDPVRLESRVGQAISDGLRAIEEANAFGRGAFEYKLYPGSFPVRKVDRVTVNGVAPFHPGNATAQVVIEQALRATRTSSARYFPKVPTIADAALIHDREIHPKLGIDLSALAGR